MARKKKKTRKIGRNAETGRFTTVAEARNNPKTHIVETLHTRGSGLVSHGGVKRPQDCSSAA
ncbi:MULTISPECIES: hypothetical protein [Pseudomonas]|jgi:hypothetical protein|uniref:hypothetical protein n=1 Tax=Pseudomonas TaxID=286 RepID=UPI0021F859FB|nr:hypothetical protein [Pseudomonas putida]